MSHEATKFWFIRSWLIVLAFCFVGSTVYSQKPSSKRKELEEKRKALQTRIAETKKVLDETKKKTSTTLTQLKVITAQIQTREKVINNIVQEIFELSHEIDESRNTIEVLKHDMDALKKDYAENITASYKTRGSFDKLVFIFNSKDFNQAFRRIKYLNQYSNYREKQAKLILRTQKEIIDAINQMIAIKQEKMRLAGMKEEEKKELEGDKQESTKVLNQLKEQEGSLKKQLAANEAAAKKLTKAISELIAREIDEARRKAEAERPVKKESKRPEGPEKPKNSSEMILSPEATKLNLDFESNKGRLPWPVESGYITETFGVHSHPTLKGVKTNNNGVDIATKQEGQVRTVFKGTVKGIFPVPGMEKVVLINHGEYFTVYANLETVTVKIGDKVDTRQTIGVVHTDTEENKTELHFEIYKQKQLQNPESWLKD